MAGRPLTLTIVILLAATPAAILPWWSLYFDTVPKVAALFAAAAMLLFEFRLFELPVRRLLHSGPGRTLAACVVLQILSLLASTWASDHRILSLFGAGWRRLGAIEVIAILIFAFLASVYLTHDFARLSLLFRALCVSAILLGGYGLFQYAGWDPFLPAASYHSFNGSLPVVRPPGTLGHATYFANYLSFLILGLIGMAIAERSRGWRIGAVCGIVLCASALVATGTRAGLLAVAAGGLFLAARLWRQIIHRRPVLLGLGAAAIVLLCFWFTPAAHRIRERWRLDPAGGTRLLVWRDSARMARSRWMLGSGPETFAWSFPRFESAALAKAYPDSYHESSHNMFLDALLSQGLPGLLVLLAIGALSLFASFRWRQNQVLGAALAAALVALIVSQQFTVFVLPTAMMFYVAACTLVAGTAEHESVIAPSPRVLRWFRAISLPLAALFILVGARIVLVDFRWAAIRRAILLHRPQDAVQQYPQVREAFPPETGAAMWYSRALPDSARRSPDLALRRQAWEQSLDAAAAEVENSEEHSNACYNLALLRWSVGDISGAESSARAAIEAAPRWFKPHWLLAEVLLSTGRTKAAREEVEFALALAGPRPELSDLLERVHQPR